MDFLQKYWDVVAGVVCTSFFAGGIIQNNRNHGRRITKLEDGKVEKTNCDQIQTAHLDRFVAVANESKEIKLLIVESNKLHQTHHDDLVKILLKSGPRN